MFHLSCFLIQLCKSVFKNMEPATRNEAFGDIQLYNNASVGWQLEGANTSFLNSSRIPRQQQQLSPHISHHCSHMKLT